MAQKRRDIPPEWKSLMDRRGLPTVRKLADAAGIGPNTLLRLIHREGGSDVETVRAVAAVLTGGDANAIRNLAGLAQRDHGDWTPPPESALLTPKQRDALNALVRSIAHPDEAVVVKLNPRPSGGPQRQDVAARKDRRKRSDNPE